MKVLVIGAGGVGEALAQMARPRAWVEQMVLADYNLERAKEVQAKLGDDKRFPVEFIDASKQEMIEELARKYGVSLIMNAVDPVYNEKIFDAAFNVGVNYMDMAMTLSRPHPEEPFKKSYVKLGDYQFERAKQWEAKGLLALVGLGVEPGVADVFARYAQDCLFDEIEEIGIRDGANLVIEGYEFAPNFSIWTTIEECLNPPVVWEQDKGWFTTEPFSEPEVFEFPEGIGEIEVVNVEHEEVLLVPRWVKTKRVTFKYGLGDQFIGVLKTLKMLGLDNKEPVNVKGVEVAPRDVVAACLPNPAYLGDKMSGKTCAGTWVKGMKDGKQKQVYLYQVADNAECMEKWGCQGVVAQVAFSPLLAMDLIEHGQWKGSGVLGPEAFDPLPFMEKMAEYGFPYGIKDM
jgi:saccharopine dehydrogenase-like NADP-dependent oxidoreductase